MVEKKPDEGGENRPFLVCRYLHRDHVENLSWKGSLLSKRDPCKSCHPFLAFPFMRRAVWALACLLLCWFGIVYETQRCWSAGCVRLETGCRRFTLTHCCVFNQSKLSKIDTDNAATSTETTTLWGGRTGDFPSSNKCVMMLWTLVRRQMRQQHSVHVLVHIYGVGIHLWNLSVLDHAEIIHDKLHLQPFVIAQLSFFLSHSKKKTTPTKSKNQNHTPPQK